MPPCKLKTFGSVGTLAVALVSSAACGDKDGDRTPVESSVVLVDRTFQSLNTADVEYLIGSYTDCARRTGPWIVASSTATPPSNFPPPLTVLAGDDDCRLTLQGLIVNLSGTRSLYRAMDPGILLGDAMSNSAVQPFFEEPSVSLDGPGDNSGPPTGQLITPSPQAPATFYANASLSDNPATGLDPAADFSGFTKNFTIHLVVSGDLASAQTATVPAVSITSASLSESVVAAPQYQLDSSSLTVAAFYAANDTVVQAPEGNISFTLAEGNAAGQSFCIVDGSFAAYADVDAAFRGNDPTPIFDPDPASGFTLPWELLVQQGDTLVGGHPVSVIIANTDATTAVRAYQVVTITFNPPAGPACASPRVVEDGQCVCSGIMLWTGSACVHPILCQSGAIPLQRRPTVNGDNCECSDGRSFVQLEGCLCPGNTWWDGSACVDESTCANAGGSVSSDSCTCNGGGTWDPQNQCGIPG